MLKTENPLPRADEVSGWSGHLRFLRWSIQAPIMMIPGTVFTSSAPNAVLYRFICGPRWPVPASIMEEPGPNARRIGAALCNLLPASVCRIGRAVAVA